MARLMVIRYNCNNDIADRLKTCLDMCGIKSVFFKDYDFVGGTSHYKIYIDKNKCTWNQVMKEVNRVHPAKFNYENGLSIINGRLIVNL